MLCEAFITRAVVNASLSQLTLAARVARCSIHQAYCHIFVLASFELEAYSTLDVSQGLLLGLLFHTVRCGGQFYQNFRAFAAYSTSDVNLAQMPGLLCRIVAIIA
jgi:hypothetical protein